MSERKSLYGMVLTYFPPLAAIVTGFCIGVIAAFWWAGNQ